MPVRKRLWSSKAFGDHRPGAASAFFTFIVVFLLLFALLRVLLLLRMEGLVAPLAMTDLLPAFVTGARFDLRMATYASLPLILLSSVQARWYPRFCVGWLSCFASVYLFLGLAELEFYAEFQQRLNSLVFTYIEQDPGTVVGMIWEGLPVLRYLAVWLIASMLIYSGFRLLFATLPHGAPGRSPMHAVGKAFLLLVVAILFARGTLRSGPPLRWGDAFVSDQMFVNHLALNGSYTLAKAGLEELSSDGDSDWTNALPPEEARKLTREMVVGGDRLVDSQSAVVRRIQTPEGRPVPPRNVVIILMESFSGQFTGVLGGPFNVTPEFDRLSREGVLFRRFFSNGTHTHQGIFATLSCFPNLPGHEYLMQQPEGRNDFSGLTTLMSARDSVFVYNGDFNWDNQRGFFRNQGLANMVGRFDYTAPVHEDPAWGVSDQDMFDRAIRELGRLDPPFIGYLQTLSNHLPYSLPEPLPVEPVQGAGDAGQRLTAMKYSDWALGQFFRRAKRESWYDNTLFVVLGDHGFGTGALLTEVNLLRFHVPMLIMAPGLAPGTVDKVASQVDVIPTILGLMGRQVRHQCWGRDVLSLPPGDPGFAVIKPSGSEPATAFVEGNKILTFDNARGGHLYRYDLAAPSVTSLNNTGQSGRMRRKLRAYVETALIALADNATGSKGTPDSDPNQTLLVEDQR